MSAKVKSVGNVVEVEAEVKEKKVRELPVIVASYATTPEIESMSLELRALQRERTVVLKSRNMQSNRLQAVVAGTIGYHSGMAEKDRTKKFAEASMLIKAVLENDEDTPMKMIIKVTSTGIEAFNKAKDELEKRMTKLVKQLPVYSWVEHKNQRGFGALFLAIVIGETGNLANYANPGKLWARMGCAPFTFPRELPDGSPAPDALTLMGATWRSGRLGKLPASEWEEYGYSPRRRSIAYLIGEGIVKQNFLKPAKNGVQPGKPVLVNVDESTSESESSSAEIIKPDNIPGPYRRRYNDKKAELKARCPDYPDLRCHRHGMLLATKLLLKNLWLEWNNYPPETKTWMQNFVKK